MKLAWPVTKRKRINDYIESHKNSVFEFSLLLVGNASAAEEISTSAFLQVCQQRGDHRTLHQSHLPLYVKVVHLAEGYMKHGKQAEPYLKDGHADTKDIPLFKERELLYEALMDLPMRDRVILVLKHTCSLSTEDVQEVLNAAYEQI
ncbi:RNA polymerase sigma factor [Halobacillus sp. K22]|uniref:RNA polymerase sigma factor n=1 Tax=Halobacillus sp. K22 TaxID=3457431 RepID=UPI003FCCFCAF